MKGRIHSIESFGTVDGPGIRLVVFFQGCPMRCLYCHNPDTWNPKDGTEMPVEEILALYEKNRTFYKNGGITATGGEPLVQMDFLEELFREAKKRNIHTCLDTSGIAFRKNRTQAFERLIKVTDLVMLDIKHADTNRHREITGHPNTPVLDFLKFLDCHNTPVWVRHVLVPGLTDTPDDLIHLGQILADYHCLKVLDVLPYHTMGKLKYDELGMEYPLKNTREATKNEVYQARQYILQGMRSRRSENLQQNK